MGLNDIIKIGDNIRRYRKEKGYTQKGMAQELGIPYSTYSNYENNNRTPDIDTLYLIAQKLDMDINALLTENHKEETEHEFIDLFLNWAYLRGYTANFSMDEEMFVQNGGAQNIIIEKDGKQYVYTPTEIKAFHMFLYEYFDAKFA